MYYYKLNEVMIPPTAAVPDVLYSRAQLGPCHCIHWAAVHGEARRAGSEADLRSLALGSGVVCKIFDLFDI